MKHLVLLDLDKTLINEQYNPTVSDSEIRRAVADCSESDLVIGLCSDSPLPLLQYWAERFGISGPIIFERGAGVFFPSTSDHHVVNPNATRWFGELRKRFVLRMLERLPEWSTLIADNTMFVGTKQCLPGNSRYAVLLSGIRAHSFAAHVRRVFNSSGTLVTDDKALAEVHDEVLRLARDLTGEQLIVDANSECGILIVHSHRTEKRNAVQLIIDKELPNSITMVGDSLPDFLDKPQVTQIAVENAADEYKKHCSFVSQASYTEGVIEILNRLTNDSL